jgi:hypothetical protein
LEENGKGAMHITTIPLGNTLSFSPWRSSAILIMSWHDHNKLLLKVGIPKRSTPWQGSRCVLCQITENETGKVAAWLAAWLYIAPAKQAFSLLKEWQNGTNFASGPPLKIAIAMVAWTWQFEVESTADESGNITDALSASNNLACRL